MALIYDLSRLARSGMDAMQYAQRDWSPYLVHFTNSTSMQSIRMMLTGRYADPERYCQCLDHADGESFGVAGKIITSGILRASEIATKFTVPCVCFSECTLPGLIGHSERYGRFGFVFEKRDIYNIGGRPCVYLDREMNSLIKKNNAQEGFRRIWGLSNVFSPCGTIQDYSHEREWRVFQDLEIWPNLKAILSPADYVGRVFDMVRGRSPMLQVLSIDMLYDWGA